MRAPPERGPSPAPPGKHRSESQRPTCRDHTASAGHARPRSRRDRPSSYAVASLPAPTPWPAPPTAYYPDTMAHGGHAIPSHLVGRLCDAWERLSSKSSYDATHGALSLRAENEARPSPHHNQPVIETSSRRVPPSFGRRACALNLTRCSTLRAKGQQMPLAAPRGCMNYDPQSSARVADGQRENVTSMNSFVTSLALCAPINAKRASAPSV